MIERHTHGHTHAAGAVIPGLPPPPAVLPHARASGEWPDGSVPHFWHGGPTTVEKLAAPRRVRTRDGRFTSCDHEVRWFLDRVAGTTKVKALKAIYRVVLDPAGWIQTGIHFKRVMTRDEATILVRVIPSDATVCGQGTAGCYSYGYEADGKPVAENGVEYIDKPDAWRIILGMELCGHGACRMEDMYTADHQPYVGSMGTWNDAAKVGYRPSRNEIAYGRQEILGTVDPALVHHG